MAKGRKRRRKLPAGSGLYWRPNSPFIWAKDPRDGRYFSTRTDVPEQAVALMSKLRAEAFEREHFPARAAATRGATLKDAADAFLAEKAHKKSIQDDRERLAKAVAYFADKPLVEIGRADIVAFLGQLKTRSGDEATPATRNRYRAVLNTTFKVAVQNGMASTNPVQTIEPLPEHNERDRVASEAELQEILAEADPELATLVTIAVWTGMRLSEILGIQPSHINWKAKSIRLGKTKTGRKRTVPMAPPVEAALRKQSHFESTSAQVSKRFHDLVERLGIEDLRFHDLRHTACTRMRQAGIDVFTMASISGHETLDMLRRYMTITEADQLAAIMKVSMAKAHEPHAAAG